MSAAVGADIESICSKCGDVWHVVVAKVGEQIAKVQCKQCGGYHRFRPLGGGSGKTKTSTTTTRRAPAAKKEPTLRISEPLVEADTSRPPRPYSVRELYKPGERIDHPTFGHGVVELIPEPGKMQVFFAEGRRVLATARPENTLSRPRGGFGPPRDGNDGVL